MGIDLEELGPEILRPYISVDLEGFARDSTTYVDFVPSSSGSVFAFEEP